jgi:hypothetical protein
MNVPSIRTLPARAGQLREAGVTANMAKTWADFYHKEAFRVLSNTNAAARALYMRAVEEVLK